MFVYVFKSPGPHAEPDPSSFLKTSARGPFSPFPSSSLRRISNIYLSRTIPYIYIHIYEGCSMFRTRRCHTASLTASHVTSVQVNIIYAVRYTIYIYLYTYSTIDMYTMYRCPLYRYPTHG